MTSRPPPRVWVACLVYATLFGVAAWPWLRLASAAVPYARGNRADERLVAYILAWGAHVLGTHPAELYGMPINFPAPLQLTGSEHLLSTELAFAPVFWWTGNAVLAASIATFLAYPLGATAMYWLACGLGCDRPVAFAAGLALALGAGQVPAHFHLLQILVLYLPLVAGTITRLRAEPTTSRTMAVATACLLAYFSSYYTFVLTGAVAVVWTLAEAARGRHGRGRFLALATVGAIGPALLLAGFSVPYAARPEAAAVLSPPSSAVYDANLATIAQFYSSTAGPLLRVLAAAGLLGFAGDASARRLARRGLLLAVMGGVLMLGPGQAIHGVTVPLPFALLAATPLKFVRYPSRFVGLVVFGRALLVAAGLKTVSHWLPRRLGTIVTLAASIAIVVLRAPLIAGRGLDTITAVQLPIYDLVREKARELGPGPLLELPMLLANERTRYTEADTLIGATRHWLPLVTGHTGFQPPHRALVQKTIAQLPAPAAAQLLVDMTHVRWLLLRPAPHWPPALASQRQRLANAPWAERVASLDGWILLRVTLEPRREQFFAAVARGWQPGFTVLGTPVVPVPGAEAHAEVGGQLPAWLPADGRRHPVDVTVTNLGEAAWPVSVPTLGGPLDPPYAGEVYLQITWRRLDLPSPPLVTALQLARDLAGHESSTERLLVPTPLAAGQYELEVAVRQRNGEGFEEAPTRRLRGPVQVQ